MGVQEQTSQCLASGHPETGQASNEPSRFLGLIVRRQRWGLSWRGRLLAAAVVILGLILLVTNIYGFLALNAPVDSRVLVVEGWVNDYVIQASVREMRLGHYDRVFTTGGPVRGGGGYTSDFRTAASICAERLVAAGASTNLVQMVPCREADRDRTFSAARALRRWFEQEGVKITSFNVITEDTHARRTRLLFERAFNGSAKVGVISIPSPDYEAKRWWHYSQGAEDIVVQAVAYLYVKLFLNSSVSN